MNARELFKSHRFEEAVAAYMQQLGRGSDRIANVGGLADALIATGRYSEALPYLEEVSADEKGATKGHIGADIEISVCEWLSANRERAISIMRSLVEGTLSGVIEYAKDRAGGVKQGLLLRYMAVTNRSSEDYHLSVSYLTGLARSKQAENWPGPVALFSIGGLSFAELLEKGVGVSDLKMAKDIVATDLLKRRYLTNIVFNAAVNARIEGDEVECNRWMKECASLENPLIEYEWHLAKREADS